jgi:hypothetical protein
LTKLDSTKTAPGHRDCSTHLQSPCYTTPGRSIPLLAIPPFPAGIQAGSPSRSGSALAPRFPAAGGQALPGSTVHGHLAASPAAWPRAKPARCGTTCCLRVAARLLPPSALPGRRSALAAVLQLAETEWHGAAADDATGTPQIDVRVGLTLPAPPSRVWRPAYVERTFTMVGMR